MTTSTHTVTEHAAVRSLLVYAVCTQCAMAELPAVSCGLFVVALECSPSLKLIPALNLQAQV